MDLNIYKPVNKDISQKYLVKLFEKYNINDELEDSQKLFIAIQEFCETLDITTVTNRENIDLFIVGRKGYGTSSYDNLVYSVKEIVDVDSAILFFAEKILKNESRIITNYEIFDLKDRIEVLERKFKRISGSDRF